MIDNVTEVLHRVSQEVALLPLELQAISSESLEGSAQVLEVALECLAVEDHIVDEHGSESVNVATQHEVQEPLKDRWCVGETETHAAEAPLA